ncbi:helix-turn-helix domain-containing protein [Shinella daejeonensis]|uniref:helix-turn-helix domain-containing protein n=1 Tax=Shinella daejeonensis TaxID=659017 RepID=UPI0020C7BB98|nr:helix-turn-helix domain-containing protein [Shinella daejeonensis]MCP8896508.1 helix-turn-helix domain-containing protein [Shinella daejeonensis]
MLVRQVANVLDILEFFAVHRNAATLAEVSQHFGWPCSNTFNLLSPLVERGFFPTTRWLVLARDIAGAEPLPESVLGMLHDLAQRGGETVRIAAPSGQQAVFLEVIEAAASRRTFRYNSTV